MRRAPHRTSGIWISLAPWRSLLGRTRRLHHRPSLFLSALVFLILGALVRAGDSMDQPRIPEELFQELRDKGHVRVLVKIARDVAAGERVADAQSAVLAILVGTDYQLLYRYTNSPFLALDIGQDALDALARSPKVESVAADRAVRPTRPDRAP